MVDIDSIERALFVNVVNSKRWDILISNNITQEQITVPNKEMYTYIKEYVDSESYPDLKALCYKFDIDDDKLGEYLSVTDLQSLCDIITEEYIKQEITNKVNKLNEISDYINTKPRDFIEQFNRTSDDLKLLGFRKRAVSLFDGLEDILTIDPSNVISTGFYELDVALIGWKRGEELVTFMARTGQGKSWMGLKFAVAAALQGERVGIYSGEMSKQQLQERVICCMKPTYTTTKEDVVELIKKNNIDIKLLTQKELRRRANVNDLEEMIIKENLTMLIVDQLSLMDDYGVRLGTPLRQQYGNISNDLFSLSSRYNLPVILLAQSNRSGAQQLNGPTLENLAESDAVAQNSTRVITMRNENGILTLQVVKNRYGESGLIQKYEVDFGINKYKPIKEYSPNAEPLKKAKARSIFGNKGVF